MTLDPHAVAPTPIVGIGPAPRCPSREACEAAMMLDPRTVARGWRQWTLTCDQSRAAHDAATRWLAEGRRVRVAIPPESGADFNDVLTRATAKINEARYVA